MIAGGSVIISPLGKVLAGPLRDKEDVLTAELDIDDTVRGKMDLDVTGSFATTLACHVLIFEQGTMLDQTVCALVF